MTSILENTKYEELCRLCATRTTMVLAIHIFENEGNIRQIGRKIDNCLPVKVHETDELPKMICQNCLYKLEMFCDFRDRTVHTERLLIELYKELITGHSSLDYDHRELDHHDHDHDQMNLPLDSADLIMVQNHAQQLSTYHCITDVDHVDHDQSDINLSQIGDCSEYQMMLNQHGMDLSSHSLDSIDLNDHGLADQEGSSDQGLRDVQGEEEGLMDCGEVHNGKTKNPANIFFLAATIPNNSNIIKYEDSKIIQQELNLNDIRFLSNYQERNNTTDIYNLEHLKKEDSNSNHSSQCSKKNMNNIFSEGNNNHSSGPKRNMNNIFSEGNSDRNGEETGRMVIGNNNVKAKKNIFSEVNNDTNDETERVIVGGNNVKAKKNIFSEVNNDVNEEVEVGRITGGNNVMMDNNNYFCNDCGFSSKEKLEYQSHFESHLLKCDGCFDVFTNVEKLNVHRKKHHRDLDLEDNTEILEKKKIKLMDSEGNSDPREDENNTEDSFEKDVKIETKNGGSSKICEECGKMYKTNYKLIEHMRKHTGEKPYQCKSCDKAFRSKIGLTQHEAKHTGKYDLSCPTCGKGFQCKSYLMAHQRVHSSDRPFPCTTCGQNFKTKQSLLDHTNRHLGVKPYICDVCGRGFITKGLCRAHQKTHTGMDNRKYSCKICNKLFVSKSYLQTHLRIHTGEKPFICEVCGKGFLTRVDLKIHSTMHTGEKSYVCEMCGKAFARRDALRCHRRSHTGERPYGCDLCGHSFTQFTTMAIHRRLHTGERPYSCETCGKGFVSRSTMMSHAKKHV